MHRTVNHLSEEAKNEYCRIVEVLFERLRKVSPLKPNESKKTLKNICVFYFKCELNHK